MSITQRFHLRTALAAALPGVAAITLLASGAAPAQAAPAAAAPAATTAPVTPMPQLQQ
jgi:hypothetical protein